MRGPTHRGWQDMELAQQKQAFHQIGHSQLALLKCWRAGGEGCRGGGVQGGEVQGGGLADI